MHRSKSFLFSCALLFSTPFLAHAGSATASFQVTLRVVNSCSITADLLRFPDYDPRSRGVSGQGQISLTCTKGAPVQVFMEGEQVLHNTTGSSVAFTLSGPGGQAWNESSSVSATGKGTEVIRIPVKGTVRGGQGVPDGMYSQTMVAKVVF